MQRLKLLEVSPLRIIRRSIEVKESKLKTKYMMNEYKVPTFGEQLVGVDFNPCGSDEVKEVKQLFAKIVNILENNYKEKNKHPLKSLLFDHAIGEVLNAQMNVVKVITLKHYKEEQDEVTREENNA
jgi:hypothetical protein